MAEVFRWSGDGLAPGTATTSSAGPGDRAPDLVTGSPTISNVGPYSPAISTVDSTVASNVRWHMNTPRSAVTIRCYLTIGAALPPSGSLPIFLQMSNSVGGAMACFIDFTSTGRFNLRDPVGVVQQGAAGVVLANQLWRVELSVDYTNKTIESRHYLDDAATPTLTLSGSGRTGLPASADQIYAGKINATGSAVSSYHLDEFIVTDQLEVIGPYENNPGVTHYEWGWDGTQIVQYMDVTP
jgi:hypothetical protein